MSINYNNPDGNALRVNGTLRLDTLAAAGSSAICRNNLERIGTCSSSLRYKREVQDLVLPPQFMAGLRPVDFTWRDGGLADVGFVAEEIAVLDPRLIVRDAQGQVEGVRYDRILSVLVAQVQRDQADATQQRSALRASMQHLRDVLAARNHVVHLQIE